MVEASVVVSAIDLAVNQMNRLLDEARQYRLEDIERCRKILDAVNAAVDGLEQESQRMLAEAMSLSDDESIKVLRTRIERYLFVDELHKKLSDAIAELGLYERELRRHADPFLLWQWKRRDREMAVQEFADLVAKLREYLHLLSEHGLRDLPNLSGRLAKELYGILCELKAPASGRERVANIAGEALKHERDPWFELGRSIREVSERLRACFR